MESNLHFTSALIVLAKDQERCAYMLYARDSAVPGMVCAGFGINEVAYAASLM